MRSASASGSADAQRHRPPGAPVAGRRQGQGQRPVERLPRRRRPFADFRADGGVDPFPQARRGQQNGGPHLADIQRQLQQAFGEIHRHAQADGQQFDHHPLRNVRGGQEGHRRIRRPQRQHLRSHLQICHDGLVRHQRHLGLARGAGGEIEDGRVGGGAGGEELFRHGGIRIQRFPAQPPQFVQGDGARGFSRQQNPVLHRRLANRRQRLRIFHKHGPGLHRGQRLHQVRGRIARV